MSSAEPQVFHFVGFVLEPDERRLTRDGVTIALTPKVFELLVLMVRSAGHVMSKDELMNALWPGRFVTESNLTKHVWILRKALAGGETPGEAGGTESCIKTVSKVGYRFVAPVNARPAVPRPVNPSPVNPRPVNPRPVNPGAAGPPDVAAAPPAGPARRGEPHRPIAPGRGRLAWAAGGVVAAALIGAALWGLAARGPELASAGHTGAAVSLIGFDNLSGSPTDAWIGPALAETLGTEIGLARHLRVIPGELARSAQAGLPRPGAGGYGPASLETLRQRLSADYVLSGSYIVSGQGDEAAVRLDFTLQDTRRGGAVALTRSGSVAELPALVTLVGADLRRDLGATTDRSGETRRAVNLQAPTAEVMRDIGAGLDALHRYDAARARDAFLEAVAQAPAYAPAYAYLAQAWSALGYQAKARAAAGQAAAYSADLPDTVRLQIQAESQLSQFDWAGAVLTLRRLVASRPGDPEPRLRLVDALISAGKPADAAAALGELRALPGLGADPRLELAAARLAAARDDSSARAGHAARALAQARANTDTGLAADAEIELAIALGGHDARKAGALLDQAMADYRRIGNPHGEAWALQNLGNLLADRDPPRARQAYERALAQYQAIGDLGGVAAAYSNLGSVLWTAGDRDGAETAVRHVLEIRRQTGDPVGQAWALAALAVGQSDETASDAVIDELHQAIALDEAAGARAHRGFSLYTLSDVLRLRGDLIDAQRTCAQSQAAYAAVRDPAMQRQADFECALIALDRGAVAAASAGLKSARQAAQQTGDAMTLGNADLTQGQIALGERRAAEAAGLFDLARREYSGAELITGEAVAGSLLALSQAALDRPQASEAAAEHARDLRGRITERQEVFEADIADAQLRGLTGARETALARLDALASDARKRRWVSLWLESRLAELSVLSQAGETNRTRALRRDLEASAQRYGFEWVRIRAAQNGRSDRG